MGCWAREKGCGCDSLYREGGKGSRGEEKVNWYGTVETREREACKLASQLLLDSLLIKERASEPSIKELLFSALLDLQDCPCPFGGLIPTLLASA